MCTGRHHLFLFRLRAPHGITTLDAMTSYLPTHLRGIVTEYIDATTTAADTNQSAALTLDDDAHLIDAHLTGKWDDDDREHSRNAHQTIRTLLETTSPEELAPVRDELSLAAEHLLGHAG